VTDLSLKQACAETQKFGRMLKGMERLVEVAARWSQPTKRWPIAGAKRPKFSRASPPRPRSSRRRFPASPPPMRPRERDGSRPSESRRDPRRRARRGGKNSHRGAQVRVPRERQSHLRVGKATNAERRLKVAQDELAAVEARLEQAKAEGRKIFGG
jgi:hypothetical protein